MSNTEKVSFAHERLATWIAHNASIEVINMWNEHYKSVEDKLDKLEMLQESKSQENKAAWLEGYTSAAACASSFQVRTGSEIDSSLNAGATMVACLLQSQVKKFKEQMVD
jgi:hypothetical protein